MIKKEKVLGLIAGSGKLPEIAARNAAAKGRRVVVVLLSEARSAWPRGVGHRVETVSLAHVGRIISILEEEGAKELLLVGKVDKKLNFADLDFDETALQMLPRVAAREDMNIAAVIIDEMSARGYHLARQTDFLEEFVTPEGLIAGALSADLKKDIEKGISVARDLARLDIGQAVVVGRGAVIAVEAFEHTNETIRRAGRLTGGGFVVVKCARPNQDLRFDVPAVGPETLRVMAKAGGRALAVESGRTLIIERERTIELAKKNSIALFGFRM